MQIFPVITDYDSEKKKWSKRPNTNGKSWKTYKASERELSHATNVGAVVPARRVVIDLDTYKGVTREAVNAALGVELDWDDALLQITVSGGEHYCFELPEGVTVRQGEGLLGIDGFDTRASGQGWICTGDGYDDQTLLGMPEALYSEPMPMLSAMAIEALGAGRVAPSGAIDAGADGDDDLAALEQAVAAQAVEGVDLWLAKQYVMQLGPKDRDYYDPWVKVGMALHHQFDGSSAAKEIWAEWSKGYDGFDLGEINSKWTGFARRNNITNPVRFDYVIHRAGGRGIERSFAVDELVAKASEVDSHQAYEALKREVLKIPAMTLPADARQMVAKAAYDAFGKGAGMTKATIAKALTPKRRAPKGEVVGQGGGLFRDWVFVETTCDFTNTRLHYSTKREGFRAIFDRKYEVIESEKDAASYALTDCDMPTVVDKMFWPGADTIFEYEGKRMLNAYHASSLEVPDELDEEGERVIGLFLAHLRMTITDEREQTILLDWMSWVIQNPGKRVGWALLLQGAQGTGKTYFAVVLELILKGLVTMLDPTAIAGRFTSWAHGSLVVVVEEVRISGTNKFEVLDRMKPFITNDTIQIEEKGRDHRTIPNFTSYMLLTNHKDAVPIVEGDRRYCVMFGRMQSEKQLFDYLGGEEAAGVYFDTLFEATKARPDALARFFLDREVTEGFSPNGRAPHTRAKEAMQAASVSPERELVEDAIYQHQCAVVNDGLVDITWLNELAESEGAPLPKARTLSAILLEMGYEQVEGRRVKINKNKKYHYVWFAPGSSEAPTSDAAKDRAKSFHDDPDFIPF